MGLWGKKYQFLLGLCFIASCADYINLESNNSLGEYYAFAPQIDNRYLSPNPSRLTEEISVGKNCKGQTFRVPPIKDLNRKDKLYTLWFVDNKLAKPMEVIEPDSRGNAFISLTINEQFLLSHLGNKFPEDFFNRSHVVEFFVSDMEYTIPESRYIDDDYSKKAHTSYAYWIVSFGNDPC